MDELKRWDVQIWFATAATAAFAAFATFLAVKQVSRYDHFVEISYSKQQLLADTHWAEGWPHLVARIITLVVVVVAALPGVLYLRDRSLYLNKGATALVLGMSWLTASVGVVAFTAMPAIDKSCACLELRDLHTEAMWSVTEVPLAATVLVFLWALRFKVRRLAAADPDEL